MFSLGNGTWISWDDQSNSTSFALVGTSRILIETQDPDDNKFSGKIDKTIKRIDDSINFVPGETNIFSWAFVYVKK